MQALSVSKDATARQHVHFIDLLLFIAILLVTSFHVARWKGYDNLAFLKVFHVAFREGGVPGVCNCVFLASCPVLKCGMVFICYVAFVVGSGIFMYFLVERNVPDGTLQFCVRQRCEIAWRGFV